MLTLTNNIVLIYDDKDELSISLTKYAKNYLIYKGYTDTTSIIRHDNINFYSICYGKDRVAFLILFIDSDKVRGSYTKMYLRSCANSYLFNYIFKEEYTNLNSPFQHFVLSYNPLSTSDSYKKLIQDIELVSGTKDLITQNFLNVYQPLKILRDAYSKIGTFKVEPMMNYLHNLEVKTGELDGVKLSESHYYTKGFTIMYLPCRDYYPLLGGGLCKEFGDMSVNISYPTPIFGNGYDSTMWTNTSKVCNLFTHDLNNVYNTPLHIGIIISNDNYIIKEQIKLLLKWSANYIRNEEYLNSRNIIYHYYECTINSFSIEEMENDQKQYNIRIFIGGCGIESVELYSNSLSLQDSLLFYTGINEGNLCKKNVFFVSPSPDQFINSAMKFLLSQYGSKIAFIYDNDKSKESQNKMIINAIKELDIQVVNCLKINLSDYYRVVYINQFILTLDHYSGRKYYDLADTYVICNLGGKELNYFLNKFSFYKYYVFIFDNHFTQYVYPMNYFLISDIINLSNTKIIDYIYRVLGSNYILNGLELKYLLPLFLLSESIKDTALLSNFDSTVNQLYSKEGYNSLFGKLVVSQDNVISHPLAISAFNSSGILVHMMVLLQQSNEANVYIESILPKTLYSCNWMSSRSEKYYRTVINIGLLLSLSGYYARQDASMLLSYLLICKLINEKYNGIRGYIILPIVKDLSSDINQIVPILDVFKKERISYIFGLSNSEMRNAIKDKLSEYKMILFYPHDYEGLECKENIVYVGVPFTSRTLIKYYIEGDYLETNYRVVILYSDVEYCRKSKDILVSDLESLDIKVLKSIRIMKNAATFQPTIEQIYTYLTSNGIIVIIMENGDMSLLAKTLYESNIVRPNYRIYFIGVDYNKLPVVYGFFLNQLIVTTKRGIKGNELNDMIGEYYNELYPYLTASSYLSSNMYYSIISVLAWKSIIENKKSFLYENFINSISGVKVDTPLGILTINENHIVSIPSLIMTIQNNSLMLPPDYKILYDSSNALSPDPYSTYLINKNKDIYKCSFTTSINNEKYKVVQFPLFLLLSQKNEIHFYQILVSSAAIVDEINLNVETSKRGRYLNLIFLFYNDNDNRLNNRLRNRINELGLGIRNENLNFLMVGCTTEYCQNIAIPVTIEYNSLLIVPGRYIGEKCYKNVFYTGPIINQVIDTTISYLENTNKQNIILIRTVNEKWDKFYEVFENSISSSMRIIQRFSVSETQRFSMETVKQLINSFDVYTGGIIMSFLSKKPFFSLLETLEKFKPDESKYFIFSMSVYPDEVVKKYNRIPYQFYYVSGVDSSVNTSDIIQRTENRLLRFIGFSKTTDDGISIAIAINGLINAMSYAGSLNLYMIKQYLYTLYLNSGQTTWFDKSNYLVRDMYVYKYSQGGIEVVKTVQRSIPKAFDWNIEENYGKICDTTLIANNYNNDNNNDNENNIKNLNENEKENYLSDSGGATSTTEIIHIILVTSNSGMYYSDYIGVSETFKEAVIQINNNGGINNKKQIDYLIIDDQSDSNVCFTKLNEALESDEYDAVFTTSSSMCLEMILPTLNERNIKLFHIGLFGGESCEKNIIHIGLEPTSIEIYILRLLNQGLKYFAIIGTSEASSIKFTTYAERYIDYLKGSVTYSVNLDENIMSLNTIAKNIKTMLPSGNTILFFGNARIHLSLSESLMGLEVKADEYLFYSFSTGEEVTHSAISNKKIDKLLPFYSIRHYFNSIESESNMIFKNILRYPLPSGLQVNGYHESIYSSLLFWSETINKYYYLISGKEKESIREIGIEYFYKNKYKSPIGDWQLATNNIIQRLTYVGYYYSNENGLMIVKEVDDNGRPKAWKKFINTGLYKCVLNDTRIGSKYKQPSNKIEIIASLNGRDELRGREVVSAILYAVDEINNNENGLIGNQIEVDIISSDSDISKLDSISKETSALTGVNAIFGGLWDKEYNIMIPYFNKAKKLLFFLGIAKGENCNSYGIVTQADLNQLIHASRSTLLSYSKAFCIIYNDKDEFSFQSKELFSKYFDLLKREYSLYIFNGINNNEEISKIGEDHSRGCVIIDLVNNELSLLLSQSLFSLSLSTVNYVYVHYFVDNYDTKGNEKFFENHYFFGSWFIAVGTGRERKYQKANEFYNKMTRRYGSYFKLVQSTEAAYTAVKLWETGVRESYSFDPTSVRKGMTGVKKEIGSSFIELMSNNYIARQFYAAQIVNSKVIIIASPSGLLDPNPFATFIEENEGKKCDFITENGIYVKPNIIHLLLILEKDYYIEEEVINAYFGFDYSVESTNSVGGINGYYIVYDCLIIDTNDIENKTIEYVSRVDESKNDNSLYYLAIFGCLGPKCRNIVSKISEENKIIYFYFGESEGEYFSKYTVTVGNTLIQKVIVAADYLRDRYKNFFILIDKENEYLFFNFIYIIYF